MVTTVKTTRSNATYADIAENYAYLNTEFGLNLAIKRLGLNAEQIENIVGRYKKGKYTGQLKGKLVWCKVIAGGWKKEFKCVIPPNVTYAYRIESYEGKILFPLNIIEMSNWKNSSLYDELIKLGKAIKAKKQENEVENEVETEKERKKREWKDFVDDCRKASVTHESNEIWYNTLLKRYRNFKCEPLREGETPEEFNDRICDALLILF